MHEPRFKPALTGPEPCKHRPTEVSQDHPHVPLKASGEGPSVQLPALVASPLQAELPESAHDRRASGCKMVWQSFSELAQVAQPNVP